MGDSVSEKGSGGRYFSQTGEDRLIEDCLNILKENDKWCAEFGAGDGILNSNSRHFIIEKNYSAVLIEARKNEFSKLKENYKGTSAACVNASVGFGKNDSLDLLLSETDIPKNFDFLSIDIDGNDYHAWDALRKYRPKLVLIEFNPTMNNAVEFIQPKDQSVLTGSSIRSINKLAKSKGYELVTATKWNAIFVDGKYFELFGIENNDPARIRKDETYLTCLFSGFDGTIFIGGNLYLPWHGVKIRASKMQALPPVLRKYPVNYGIIERILFRIFKKNENTSHG